MESQQLHLVLDEIAAEINRRLPDANAFNEHTEAVSSASTPGSKLMT